MLTLISKVPTYIYTFLRPIIYTSTLVARKQREVPRSTSIKYVNKEKEDIIQEECKVHNIVYPF